MAEQHIRHLSETGKNLLFLGSQKRYNVVMRLRVKLLLIYGAVILGGTALALVVVEKTAGRALRSSAEDQLQQSANLLAVQGENRIGVELSKLKSWAAMPMVAALVLDERDSERALAFQDYFAEVVQRERRHSFYLLNRSGDCIASDDPRRIGAMYAREVVSRMESARRAYAGETTVGKSVFSTTTARPLMPITAPVRHNGEVVAILRTAVDMDLLREHLFAAIHLGGQGRVYIDDPELEKTLPERHELLTPGLHPRWTPPPLAVQQAMQTAPEDIHYHDGADESFVLASARMDRVPWVITICQPLDEVLAPVKWLHRTVLRVVVVLFGLLVIATLVLIAPVVRGIEKCRTFAGTLEAGRLDERLHLESSDEVGELARGLNAMAVELEQSRNALAAAEVKFRALYENAVEGIFQTDSDGTMLAANPALARISGFDSPEQMPGLNAKVFYANESDREYFVELLRRNRSVEHFEFDLRRKDGEIRRASLSAQILSGDPDGDFVMQGFLEDITERHAAQTAASQLFEAERLLSEAELRMLRFQLNPHFLFNALNSVNALIEDHPESATKMVCLLADFCRATLLVPDDGLATVESETGLLRQYLAIERMRWQDALDVDVDVENGLGDIRIPVFTLQPLAENAIKYGQLSGSDPLEIRVRIIRQNGGMRIEVANTGRWFDPADRPQASAGVGLANLKNRLEHVFGKDAILETEASAGWVCVRILLTNIECRTGNSEC